MGGFGLQSSIKQYVRFWEHLKNYWHLQNPWLRNIYVTPLFLPLIYKGLLMRENGFSVRSKNLNYWFIESYLISSGVLSFPFNGFMSITYWKKGFNFFTKYIRNSILLLTDEMYINFLFFITTEYAEDNPVLLGKISEGLSI